MCCGSGRCMLFVMCGSMIFSSVLAMGERSDMGLLEVPIAGSLCCLGIGIVFAVFHV